MRDLTLYALVYLIVVLSCHHTAEMWERDSGEQGAVRQLCRLCTPFAINHSWTYFQQQFNNIIIIIVSKNAVYGLELCCFIVTFGSWYNNSWITIPNIIAVNILNYHLTLFMYWCWGISCNSIMTLNIIYMQFRLLRTLCNLSDLKGWAVKMENLQQP